MSTDSLISLDNVSKCYRRYDRPGDRLKEIFWKQASQAQEFWALRDISLRVQRGETLGIIGRNGSGKSTLLQIIAGTLAPTSGILKVQGRIAALLELGSGFNIEFTGRENVYFNGQVLGLKPVEIEEKFAEITAFADIGDFIDQPVKTYSSGMMVRLAFAVATSVEPDILIVDEALAVGDIHFQAKCFKRMRNMMDRGITVLFVSHDTSTMTGLCDRCLWLKHGQIAMEGKPKDVTQAYRQEVWEDQGFLAATSMTSKVALDQESSSEFEGDVAQSSAIPIHQITESERIGNGDIQIIDFQLLDARGRFRQDIDHDELVTAEYTLKANRNVAVYDIGLIVKDLKGNEVFSILDLQPQNYPVLNPGQVIQAKVTLCFPLRAGAYYMTLGVIGYQDNQRYDLQRVIIYDHLEYGYFFNVNLYSKRVIHGPVHFEVKFTVNLLEAACSESLVSP
ncbi:ABC transporter ATP-binding protein [Thermosynechococcaceae cyanobacterium BACA0444]|uniref:ABC transporter ATP-binding protein n=1 Tax=Pseudocalidococcus azoricus BACA0444 TaxID=2918990 RepID=A0AAE4FPR8_9CYAN|nr:ABC transporter ATP-binding protein [Pseudocalidococcus azoricus]MDS3859433.1 ABC transporter ATP-binding protein [Pseudocalidococcus azoricus BACA0444]